MIEMLLWLIRLYEIILVVRILMSWINPDPRHPIVQWVHRLTDPVLEPIRRILPTQGMGIDFSPIVVFLLLRLLARVLAGMRFY